MCVLSLTVKTCTSESELELLCDSESESLVSMILTRVVWLEERHNFHVCESKALTALGKLNPSIGGKLVCR